MKFLSKLSNDTVIYNELSVKCYRELLKCILGDKPDPALFVENLCDILESTTNKSADYFKNLNVIDLFCLILDIRSNSLGTCKIVLNEGEKNLNIELNLDLMREDLSRIFPLLQQTISHNNITLEFHCPSVIRLLEESSEEYLPFIKSCNLPNNKSLFITSNNQASGLFERLSPSLSLQLVERYNLFMFELLEINFLSCYNITKHQMNFLPNLDFLIWFMKIMFNESLNSFYENIFHLSYTGKMNIEYVENLSVGEYNYFLGLLRSITAESAKSKPEETIGGFSEDPF